jgi:hypothetical protein
MRVHTDMELDLYKIYKAFYQRHHRDQWCELRAEMSRIAHDFVVYIHSRINSGEKPSDLAEEYYPAISALKDLEYVIGPKIYFSRRLDQAIKSGAFCVKVPYPVLHRWSDYNVEGKIYIFSSNLDSSISKLGACTIPISKRVSTFEKRYNTQVSEFFSIKANRPFRVEHELSKLIKDYRISGNQLNKSIEWYKLAPSRLKLIICDNIDSIAKGLI